MNGACTQPVTRLELTFIPIATQSLPAAAVTVELSVIEPVAFETITLSVPPDTLAATVGLSGFGPISYFSMSCAISLRRQRHPAFVVMRVPSCIANGSGSFG